MTYPVFGRYVNLEERAAGRYNRGSLPVVAIESSGFGAASCWAIDKMQSQQQSHTLQGPEDLHLTTRQKMLCRPVVRSHCHLKD
jgi:hypothetical protein